MKPVPALLKRRVKEVEDDLEMAFTYLQAYKDTGDWGYIPTVEHCLARITRHHMLKANTLLNGDNNYGSQSNADK